jgi:hypothetical protein
VVPAPRDLATHGHLLLCRSTLRCGLWPVSLSHRQDGRSWWVRGMEMVLTRIKLVWAWLTDPGCSCWRGLSRSCWRSQRLFIFRKILNLAGFLPEMKKPSSPTGSQQISGPVMPNKASNKSMCDRRFKTGRSDWLPSSTREARSPSTGWLLVKLMSGNSVTSVCLSMFIYTLPTVIVELGYEAAMAVRWSTSQRAKHLLTLLATYDNTHKYRSGHCHLIIGIPV